DRGRIRLRHDLDVRYRRIGLPPVPADRRRAQEPVSQDTQGRDREHRGYRRVRQAAGGTCRDTHNCRPGWRGRRGDAGGGGGAGGGAGGGGGAAGGTGTGTGGNIFSANNNADNIAVGDNNGIALPAVINEVVSVTGVYPFPFINTPSTAPIDTPTGVI